MSGHAGKWCRFGRRRWRRGDRNGRDGRRHEAGPLRWRCKRPVADTSSGLDVESSTGGTRRGSRRRRCRATSCRRGLSRARLPSGDVPDPPSPRTEVNYQPSSRVVLRTSTACMSSYLIRFRNSGSGPKPMTSRSTFVGDREVLEACPEGEHEHSDRDKPQELTPGWLRRSHHPELEHANPVQQQGPWPLLGYVGIPVRHRRPSVTLLPRRRFAEATATR